MERFNVVEFENIRYLKTKMFLIFIANLYETGLRILIRIKKNDISIFIKNHIVIETPQRICIVANSTRFYFAYLYTYFWRSFKCNITCFLNNHSVFKYVNFKGSPQLIIQSIEANSDFSDSGSWEWSVTGLIDSSKKTENIRIGFGTFCFSIFPIATSDQHAKALRNLHYR